VGATTNRLLRHARSDMRRRDRSNQSGRRRACVLRRRAVHAPLRLRADPDRIAVVSGAAFSRASSSVTHAACSGRRHRIQTQRTIRDTNTRTAQAATNSTTITAVSFYSDLQNPHRATLAGRTSRWRPRGESGANDTTRRDLLAHESLVPRGSRRVESPPAARSVKSDRLRLVGDDTPTPSPPSMQPPPYGEATPQTPA
jgi:hypothetical protein